MTGAYARGVGRITLSGKPIAITGASSGIGRATAMVCAASGMPVALMARRRGKLDEVATAIRAIGGTAWVFEGNVDEAGAGEAFIAGAEAALGPLHAVFANAGYGFEKATWSLDDRELRAIFETNVWGSLNVIRPALPGMIERGAGHVLLCSSCLSKIGVPMYGAYCATKAVQDHMARAMRHELRPSGVWVSSVHPIGTRTEFFEQAGQRSGTLRLMDRRSEQFMQPPERAAKAVVACLRRPRGEVWTSATMRMALGVATMLPGLADAVIGVVAARRGLR